MKVLRSMPVSRKFYKGLFISLLLIAPFWMGVGWALSESVLLDESTSATSVGKVFSLATRVFAGQADWEPSENATITAIEVYFTYEWGTFSQDLVAEIYNMDGMNLGTQPTGTCTSSAKTVTAAGAVKFDGMNCPITTGGNYAVVVRRSDTSYDETNHLNLGGFATDEYANSNYRTWGADKTNGGNYATYDTGMIIYKADVPTLTSATIAADGETFTMVFSESVSIGAGGNGGFTITPSGAAATLSYSSGSGSSTLVYTISREIKDTETATMGYTQPGNGVESTAYSLDLANVSDGAVTNDSEIPGTQAGTPSADNGTGTYSNTVSVALSSTTEGATICYTTDGSSPGAATPGTCDGSPTNTYSGALSVTATGTVIKAIATKADYANSDLATFTFTLTAATPTFNNGTATYNNDVSVTISSTTTSAAIVYCTDTDNTCTPETEYSSPVSITATGTYLRSKATKASYNDSAVASALYTLTNSVVSLSPDSYLGQYLPTETFTLSVATTTGGTIRYTTNGVDPTCGTGTLYEAPITLLVGTINLKAIGCKTNYNASTVKSQTFIIRNATTYYIDNCDVIGNDSNNGTSTATPWLTTVKVDAASGANKFVPGDSILFRAGCEWRDALVRLYDEDGVADAPITFGSYGSGAQPILNGTSVKTDFTTEGSIYYKAVTSALSVRQIFFDDVLLVRNQVSKETLATGEWWRDEGNNRIYIYDNPSGHTVEWGDAAFVFTTWGYANYIIVENLHVTKSDGAGIVMDGHSGNGSAIVQNCTVTKSYSNGISIGAEDDGGISSGAIVRNNVATANGIAMQSETGTPYNIIVGHNTGSATNYVTGTLIQGNSVSGSNGGIKCDWFTDNIIIEKNVIEDGNTSTDGGRYITWRYNIIKNCSGNGLSIFHWEGPPGPPYSFSSDLIGMTVVNNTFVNCGNGTYAIQLGGNALTNSTIKNNIFYNNDAASIFLLANGIDYSGTVIDYNLYFTGANPTNFVAGGATKNFAQWQAYEYDTGVSPDTNSINADPLFVSTSDFNLQVGSPARRAGVDVGAACDFAGNPVNIVPSIGTYDYSENATIGTGSGIKIGTGAGLRIW